MTLSATIPSISIEMLKWEPHHMVLHGTFTRLNWDFRQNLPNHILILGKTAYIIFEFDPHLMAYKYSHVHEIIEHNRYMDRAQFIDVKVYLEKI